MNRAAGLGRGSTSPSLIAHPLSTGSETLQHQHSSSSSSPQSVVEPCFDYSKAAQLSMAANSHATPPPNPLIIDMPQLLLECGLAARYRTAFPPTLSLEELHNLTEADLRIKFGVKSADDLSPLTEGRGGVRWGVHVSMWVGVRLGVFGAVVAGDSSGGIERAVAASSRAESAHAVPQRSVSSNFSLVHADTSAKAMKGAVNFSN